MNENKIIHVNENEKTHENITPKSDRKKVIQTIQKIVDKLKGNPDEEAKGLVARALARLVRQKREDGEL